MSYDNPNYDPAANPLPVPSVAPSEDKRYRIEISEGWKYVLVSMLNRMTVPGAWQGDAVQQRQAVSDTVALIESIFKAVPVDCEEISDCIDTSENVEISIINLITNSTIIENYFTELIETSTVINEYFNETINNYIFNIDNPARCCEGSVLDDTELDIDLIPDAAVNGCDDDRLFGAARQLVDEFANAISQLFEELAFTSSTFALAEIVLDFFDIPPITVISGLAEFFVFLREIGESAWNVADSEENRDRLACLLFCAFRVECQVNFDIVKEVSFQAWDEQVGFNLRTVKNFVEFIDKLPTSVTQWAQWTLFLGMFVYTIGGSIFLRRVLFINPSRPVSWWSDRLKLGYLTPNPAWTVDCDDCIDPNCGFYVINFETFAAPGLPTGWQDSPPTDMPNEVGGNTVIWANERGSDQGLRGFDYPTYGIPQGDFVALCASFEIGDAPCTLKNVSADGIWPITANTKSISVYALRGYQWGAREFLGKVSILEGTVEEPPNFLWEGTLENVTNILISVKSVRGNQTVGGAAIRFLRINQGV